MKPKEIINWLKRTRKINVECPCCLDVHQISKLDMFLENDLTENAEEFISRKQNEINEMKNELKKLKHTKLQQITAGTRASNFGKLIEKYAPLLPGFIGKPEESIPLLDPIDYLVFNGLTKGRIDSVGFIDIKSGNGSLNHVQKSIKNTIELGKVELKILKGGAK